MQFQLNPEVLFVSGYRTSSFKAITRPSLTLALQVELLVNTFLSEGIKPHVNNIKLFGVLPEEKEHTSLVPGLIDFKSPTGLQRQYLTWSSFSPYLPLQKLFCAKLCSPLRSRVFPPFMRQEQPQKVKHLNLPTVLLLC